MRKSPPRPAPSDEIAGLLPPTISGVEPAKKSKIGGPPCRIEIEGRTHTLLRCFDPDAARARFQKLHGIAPPQGEDFLDLDRVDRLLVAMANDQLAGHRPLTVANAKMIEEISALRAEMPNFSHFLSEIEISARASLNAQIPLSIAPSILVGEPGTGKTRACRRLAEILHVHYQPVSIPSMSGGHALSGTDSTWKSTRPGIVAEALIHGGVANPLILLDEIDKCADQLHSEHPLDALHDLWEREGAIRFKDDCLQIRFDTSSIYWICTANELHDIRPSLLDRAHVIEISAPSADEMGVIIASAYGEACARWAGWFAPELAPTIIDRLRSTRPRLAHRVLGIAMKFAAAHGRREISIDDANAALQAASVEEKPKMGFR